MDQWIRASSMKVRAFCQGEGAEPKGKALNLLVHLFQPSSMVIRYGSWLQEHDPEYKQLSPLGGQAQPYKQGEELYHLGGVQSTAIAPPHQKKPAEVVQPSN